MEYDPSYNINLKVYSIVISLDYLLKIIHYLER